MKLIAFGKKNKEEVWLRDSQAFPLVRAFNLIDFFCGDLNHVSLGYQECWKKSTVIRKKILLLCSLNSILYVTAIKSRSLDSLQEQNKNTRAFCDEFLIGEKYFVVPNNSRRQCWLVMITTMWGMETKFVAFNGQDFSCETWAVLWCEIQ